MPVYDVWFWWPFHMLQAYPLVRNSPIPDFLIPFAHLIWVPYYIWEHWAGLCDPVKEAWAMQRWILPTSLVLALSFFYFTYKHTDYPNVVKIGFVLYFGFMLFSGRVFGFEGNPATTYEAQITANADVNWNNQHVFLHVWFLVVLWVTALTVPHEKLSLIRAGKDPTSSKSDAPAFFGAVAASSDSQDASLPTDISLFEVFQEVLYGETLLPEFSAISRTCKYLIVQGVVYAATGLLMLLCPNAVFAKIMFLPEPFEEGALPYVRLAGFALAVIGWYFIMQSRTNNPYWIIVGIFTRICFAIPCMPALTFIYGVPIQIAGTFFILDPTFAYTTYLSMKADVKMKYTSLS